MPIGGGGLGGGGVTTHPVEGTLLTEGDIIGWGGIREKDRNNYLVTEDSEPAPKGASLGWLIQLDGDTHRNAFLNSPWVKAVIPIQPGKEEEAFEWLKKAGVEGMDGLDARYDGSESDLCDPHDRPEGVDYATIGCVLKGLARKIKSENSNTGNVVKNTEVVFENGFDPLEGGFRVPTESFQIFDQWIEVLPTDQTVAVEYDAQTATP